MKILKNRKLKFIIGGLFLMVLLLFFWFFWNNQQTASAGWWNDAWLYRQALTVNQAKVAATLTNFPMLVSLTDSDFIGKAQDDGGDFVFTLQDGTVLSHEIESFASSTGTLVAWVRMPQLTNAYSQAVYMYYGNASIVNQESPAAVWDDGFKGVWHMDNSATASTTDSTQYANNGTMVGPVASTTSKIGNGLYFDGGGDRVNYGDFQLANTGHTLCAWIKMDASQVHVYSTLFSKLTSGVVFWDLYTDNDNHRLGMSVSDNSGVVAWKEQGTITAGSFTHVCGVYAGGLGASSLSLYVNGNLQTGGASGGTNTTVNWGSATFLNGSDLYGSFAFGGVMDEARVSNVARTAAWIQTEFNNQNDPASFFAVQAEEVGPGPAGYWSFDEGYGATAHDASGQGNDGTLNGGVIWKAEEECISGKCLWFDGLDQTEVTVDVQDNMEEFTACAWFKANALTNLDSDTEMIIINKLWYLQLLDTGAIEFEIPTSAAYPVVESSAAILPNQWYYVCGVYRGVDEIPQVFINGQDDSQAGDTGSGTQVDDSSYLLRVGATYPNEYANNFFGYIDEVKIYPYARTADQIKQDYNAGLAGQSASQGAAASFGGSSDKWLTDGLVGYWKMDEAAGAWDSDGVSDDTVDSSGFENTGSAYGNASTTAAKFGNGGNFDGTGDYLNLGDRPSLVVTTDFTFSAWVFWNGSGNSMIYVSGNTNFQYYSIGINSNSGCSANYFEFVEDGGPCYPSDTTFPASSWHHVTIVKNGDSGENLTFYIDGNQDGSASVGDVFADGTKRIGARVEIADRFFNGMLDEIRIYNRALSPVEVRKLYEWAPGPLAYWKFDELSGTTAFDSVASSSTAGGNDGVLYYADWVNGKYGGALDFDDENYGHVNMGNPAHLQTTGSLSVSAWVYFRSFQTGGADDTIAAKSLISSDIAWTLKGTEDTGNETIGFTISGNGTSEAFRYGATELQLNKWYHIAGVYDASAQVMDVYLNGILDNGTQSGSIPSLIFNSTADFWIGSMASEGWPLDGLIDDVRIYNYARTQKQILEDMLGTPKPGGGVALKAPVLHLDFDKGYGAVANDASGHGKNLTISSATRWRNAGKFGRTYYGGDNQRAYDDADDNDLDFGTSTDFSLSAWVRIAANPAATQYILDKHDDAGYEGYALYMNTSGQVGFGIGDTSSASFPEDEALSSADLADNTWHHILGRKTGNSKIELFVDRVLAATDASLAADATLENSATLYIGDNNATNGTDEFLGYIDEVRIYNFAVNEDEINTLYNGSVSAQLAVDDSRDDDGTAVTGQSKEYCVPGDTSECSAPVINLDFNEKSGTTAYDTSAYGRNGTLNWMSTSTNGGWTRGKNGSGLEFDGLDDYVSLASIGNLTDYSIELWYKPTERIYSGNTGKNSLYTLEDAVDTDLYLYHSSADDGELRFRCFEPTNNLLTTTADWEKDRWYHIAATYTNTGTRKRIYVNGVLENSEVASCPFEATGDHWIGAGTYYTNAVLDGFKLFNYERTPAQVAWDYNRGAPVAHWSFDECESSAIHDESVNMNHGQLYLGTTGVTATGTCASSSDSFWYNGRSGKYKSGGSFDGTNDYVNADDSSSLDLVTEGTISAWIKRDTVAANVGIVAKGTTTSIGTHNYRLSIDSSNLVSFQVGAPGTSDIISADTLYTYTGEWHHIAASWSTIENSMRIYIDGILDGSDNCGITPYTNDAPVSIGQIGGDTWRFDGQIDEVKIWNYALTPNQISQEYNGGAVRFGE
ncbi:MAG: DUF2341 domain-containing protein [Candidatus Falkowbacteria bacterium]